MLALTCGMWPAAGLAAASARAGAMHQANPHVPGCSSWPPCCATRQDVTGACLCSPAALVQQASLASRVSGQQQWHSRQRRQHWRHVARQDDGALLGRSAGEVAVEECLGCARLQAGGRRAAASGRAGGALTCHVISTFLPLWPRPQLCIHLPETANCGCIPPSRGPACSVDCLRPKDACADRRRLEAGGPVGADLRCQGSRGGQVGAEVVRGRRLGERRAPAPLP